MIRRLRLLLVGLSLGILAGGLGVVLLWSSLRPAPKAKEPDPPALIERIREVARLQTLDVSVYKKVSYEPDPMPSATFVGELVTWASYAVAPPQGTAIVFADVHLSMDLARLDDSSIHVDGTTVEIVLPPFLTQVELKPGETEVVRSNLDPQETMTLLDNAKFAIQADVSRDTALEARARASAEASLRALLGGLGFTDVRFVTVTAPAI